MSHTPKPVKTPGRPPLTQAAEGLAQIAAVLREESIQSGVAAGLSAAQARALSLLSHAPTGMRLSEVALRLGASPPSTSDTMSGLVRRKLVRRDKDPLDARAARFVITARAGARAQLPARQTAIQEALADLTPSERTTLQRILVRLILSLQRRGRIPVGRACVNCRFFRPLAHPRGRLPHHCDYVGKPFGDGSLRVLCAEFQAAAPEEARANQEKWSKGGILPRATGE